MFVLLLLLLGIQGIGLRANWPQEFTIAGCDAAAVEQDVVAVPRGTHGLDDAGAVPGVGDGVLH